MKIAHFIEEIYVVATIILGDVEKHPIFIEGLTCDGVAVTEHGNNVSSRLI